MLMRGDVDLFPFCSVSVAAYLATVGWIWRRRAAAIQLGERLWIDDARQLVQRSHSWLIGSLMVLFCILVLAQLPLTWNAAERAVRFTAAMVPLCAALGLAAVASSVRRQTVAVSSLVFFALFGIYCSWADVAIGPAEQVWIQRLVRLMVVTGCMTYFYGALVPRLYRFSEQWLSAIRKATGIVAVAALVTLLGILLFELSIFEPGVGVAAIGTLEAAAVAIALVLMTVGLVVMAVNPNYDPLSASTSVRKMYVYAAQVVAALLVLHLWLTVPLAVSVRPLQVLAVILIAVSFAGAGLAELFRRRDIEVLADPLGTSGIVVSFLPAVLMWFVASEADRSAVLLALGILHLGVGIVRGSLILGCSSILFGNLALWTFYSNFDHWSILDRPQFWLIPPAASLLLAAQWRRDRLTPQQLTLVRYGCVAVIYVSSTSEVFIGGVGTQLWPPIILATLSVLGVLVGMAIRVRAYLYLGTSFLFVSLVSMVMHAQQRLDHVWPWWAFGICLGIGILVLFGLFEKKRSDLTGWTEKLSQWDA